jgi:hypothetical protein
MNGLQARFYLPIDRNELFICGLVRVEELSNVMTKKGDSGFFAPLERCLCRGVALRVRGRDKYAGMIINLGYPSIKGLFPLILLH